MGNDVLIAAGSFAVGVLLAWIFLRSRSASEYERGRADGQGPLATESQARAVAEERASRIPDLEEQLRARSRELIELQASRAELSAQLDASQKKAASDVALLLEAKNALADQFRNVANAIFDDKSEKFVKKNEESVEAILKPLRDGLAEFKSKVEFVYDKESKERFSLQAEIKRLVELNGRISEDAVNLTNALKGQNKAQGNWGELVLERVLEGSGLQKGREYDVQVSLAAEGGGRAQPDVIVRLPEGKCIIVDSKVSLLAYDEYCSAETDEARAEALARHVASIRAHFSGLSAKNYQSLYGLKSLDFVLMFMPIEPAFKAAMEADKNLYTDAFRKNIMIVGPWNLLVSLKTISNVWRYEYQNRNAQELARQCAALYDKFVGFVADIEDIGKKLGGAQASYRDALGKLSTGRGNLVSQVERIKELGVKPSKSLPPALVESAIDDVLTPSQLTDERSL